MRRLNVNRLALAVAVLLIGITTFYPAIAQNESGVRPINRDAFEKLGFWYNSKTARFHTQYPIIRSLPPLNSGMPWDILVAYVYMDSLARFDKTRLAENTLNRWRIERRVTDTLLSTAKYLYKLVDYNPYLFTQYIDEISLKYRGRYWASLRSIASGVSITLFDALPDTSRKVAMLALLETSYVLRVKILAIDSMPTGNRRSPNQQYYRATAAVVDTLKGQVFQPCWNDYGTKDTRLHRPASASADGCIQFVYLDHLYSNPRFSPDGAPKLYSARDHEFATGPDSAFAMRAGQEAVVFISHAYGLVDSSYDYYQLRLEPRASFGALPIINGKVRDVNRIWSQELLLNYADWRNRFFELRGKLLSGTY